MKTQSVFISLSLLFSAILAGADSAKAASLISNVSYTDTKNNVILNSIHQNGTTFNNFSYVSTAKIIYNTPRNQSANSGAASTDRGDNATSPLPTAEDPTRSQIAAFLGNNNLNNIIDTEDIGAFTIDVFFDSQIVADNSGLDNLFFWERGMNSDLGIQALDNAGNVIGNFKKIIETRNSNNYANFRINTTEINEDQKVGSWGVSLQDLGVSKLSGLRLTSQANYKGPDFKVIARKSVPEPSTILGLGVIAGIAFLQKKGDREQGTDKKL
ncbi:exosortase-dependent surface protein XDP2 [Anabaena azotica]|uniref:exosortase-dependent surface protein XDP2 n=1 Tax=Anabaena azotica TaxID=197653 RepID=UPI0039A60570